MMTAAEAERIKAALLDESSHLRKSIACPNGTTHHSTCDCQFLRALDAVIEGEAMYARAAASLLGVVTT